MKRLTIDVGGTFTDCLVLEESGVVISPGGAYGQSGEGWYHATFFPESTTGWNTITVDKKDMSTEGQPAGWGHIKAIRISACGTDWTRRASPPSCCSPGAPIPR